MRLKEIRTENNETQQELAIALGLSVSTISQVEQGRRNLSDKLKVKVADHYGQTVQSIFFDAPITYSNSKASN